MKTLSMLTFGVLPPRLPAKLRAEYGGRLRLPDALVVATAHVLHTDCAITTDGR